MMKKNLLVILLLLSLSIPAVKDLFIPGGFTSHDLTHHVVRQVSMDKLISDGQFPPRWSDDLNQGYGYPLFLFNYPLPALFGEAFHKLGLNFVDCVKAVLFLGLILGVPGMYLFLKEFLGSRLAASLGAMFFLYAPLRFLNTYVSAAVGSVLSLGIVPFVFYFLIKVSKKAEWAPILGGVTFALLVLAHNVTALIFFPVFLAFAGFLVWRVEKKAPIVRSMLVMLGLGLGLSAWFWMPAMLEKQYIRFDEIFSNFYQDQFPSLSQLIYSPWGYGLSHPDRPEPGDMSYQIGLGHLLAMLVFSLWFIVYGRKSKEKILGVFVLAAFLLSIFMMLKISLPVWDNLPLLSLVQFPLRFEALTVFATSVAAALLVKYLPYKSLPVIASERSERGNLLIRLLRCFTPRNDVLQWILVFSLLFLVFYANRNHWHINEVFSPGDIYYQTLRTTGTTYGEHLPKWGSIRDKLSPGKFEFVKGDGRINPEIDKSNYVLANIEASNSASLRFNQYYFPDWQIKVDGKTVAFNYLTDGESYGLPVFDIEKGQHKIAAKFVNTPVRNLADSISLTTLIVCVTMILWMLYRNKKLPGKK